MAVMNAPSARELVSALNVVAREMYRTIAIVDIATMKGKMSAPFVMEVIAFPVKV